MKTTPTLEKTPPPSVDLLADGCITPEPEAQTCGRAGQGPSLPCGCSVFAASDECLTKYGVTKTTVAPKHGAGH